jgi:hypothetical protein
MDKLSLTFNQAVRDGLQSFYVDGIEREKKQTKILYSFEVIANNI